MQLLTVLFTAFLHLSWVSISSPIIVWNMKQESSPDAIEINDDLIGRKEDPLHDKLQKKVDDLKKYTLDEKCSLGKDLGVGFQIYTPYVDMGFGSGGKSIDHCAFCYLERFSICYLYVLQNNI